MRRGRGKEGGDGEFHALKRLHGKLKIVERERESWVLCKIIFFINGNNDIVLNPTSNIHRVDLDL